MATQQTAREGAEGVVPKVSQRALTIGLCATIVAIAFETISVATAMPVAARDLDGLSYYAWAFSLFLIGMLLATVVCGRLSDRIGSWYQERLIIWPSCSPAGWCRDWAVAP